MEWNTMGGDSRFPQEVVSVRKWSIRRKSVLMAISLFLIGTALVTAYVHDKYFFNPLTFRNDDVLYLPWKWYTKPLNMQIFELVPSANKLVEIKDPIQIKYVISELEKGSTIKSIPFKELNHPPTDPAYGIYIRTETSVVLQSVHLYPKEKMASIWTQHGNLAENEFISLTPGLLEYVKKQLGSD
jgi:hypothetical protein